MKTGGLGKEEILRQAAHAFSFQLDLHQKEQIIRHPNACRRLYEVLIILQFALKAL